MKSLKIITYALFGIITTFLLSNFFFNEKFKIITSVNIKSSPFIIYDQINNFKNWENWDPWLIKDTTIKINISNKTFGVGAYRTWESENSGNGRIEIINTEYIKQIDFEINIDKNHPIYATFYLESYNNKVKLTWQNKGSLPFVARVFGPVISKMMKSNHIEGLNLLKDYCESIPSQTSNIMMKEWNSKYVISVTDTCSSSNMSQSLTKIYSKINKYISKNNIGSNETPFVQYLSFPKKPGDNDSVILRAGTFIEAMIEDSSINRMSFYQISTKQTVQAIHTGDYRTIFDTHQKIKDFCQENNYSTTGNPYEIYITDPSQTPNPDEWQTRVIYEIE